MNPDATWYGGRCRPTGPGHIVLNGGQLSPERGTAASFFMSIVAKRSPISATGEVLFAHTVLHNPQILSFTIIFNLLDTPKVPLPVGVSTPHVIPVPWTRPTQRTKLHLDRFSRFYAAYGRESPYSLQCALKRLTRD